MSAVGVTAIASASMRDDVVAIGPTRFQTVLTAGSIDAETPVSNTTVSSSSSTSSTSSSTQSFALGMPSNARLRTY